jgi:hypothetical protein
MPTSTMSETPFIITIDTEGDNLWDRPRDINTRNAAFLPRFQSLCERFRFKPVYLTNYEMAMSSAFVEFGRDVAARGTGEIGMHLHAWNSPPLIPLTNDDFHHQPYLIEYPDEVMREKIKVMTRLLEDRFDRPMLSHRAGRWAIDGRYAAMLSDEGYRVDCSVAPGVDWSRNRGDPAGKGGVNYSDFPHRPYFLSSSDISRPGNGPLLEVPMTVRSSALFRTAPWTYRIPLLRGTANRLAISLGWLCPVQPALGPKSRHHCATMLAVARAARREDRLHLEFMLHSSELMPGGSPTFRTAADIEHLYEHLEILFGELSAWCRGTTLAEFQAEFRKGPAEAADSRPGNAASDALVSTDPLARGLLKPSGELE